ncbi:MAG: hypothetical protein ACE5HD_02920 [Acidobacteriota bacterium]
MARRNTGLLLFIDEPPSVASRWPDAELSASAVAAVVDAVHRDLLANLSSTEGVTIYLAPTEAGASRYVDRLAQETGTTVCQVPGTGPMQRWEASLSILYNERGHRKILCVAGGIPDLYPEDLARIRRKLDLYPLVVGREGEDRCWLLGMNGYHDVLHSAQVRPDDLLHPILKAASGRGLEVSVVDTKHAIHASSGVRRLRLLASRPQHPRLKKALAASGLSPLPRPSP